MNSPISLSFPRDTICAIATPTGGAIGLIRISGPNAIALTEQLFQPAQGKPLSKRAANTITFGYLKEKNRVLDEVLVSLFRAPHSYTGEDSIEISCHGSSYILQHTLELLIQCGGRVARPGEFTQRAFLAGKMDLSQAEAVADLIAADSAAAHRLAINQMRGTVSEELRNLRNQLLHITSLLELELDFSDHEDLIFADRSQLKDLTDLITKHITRLTNSFQTGNALKNGIPVAIIGDTNAGKSTLLNRLLGEERAIVSDIHGTTRDVIEDTLNIDGVLFRLIDTAGIRTTEDTIERIGIERTFARITKASIILWVLDATNAEEQYHRLSPSILPLCQNKYLLLLLNKSDKSPSATFTADLIPKLSISALTGKGIDHLKSSLLEASQISLLSQNETIITNARHYEALQKALSSILRVKEGLINGISGEFISQDLRECIHQLSDIIGEVTSDNVLHNIFKNFCIGK